MKPVITITIYEPNQRAKVGFFRTWVVMTRNIIAVRELIWQLIRRDLLMAYKKSFLGMAWILIAFVNKKNNHGKSCFSYFMEALLHIRSISYRKDELGRMRIV